MRYVDVDKISSVEILVDKSSVEVFEIMESMCSPHGSIHRKTAL